MFILIGRYQFRPMTSDEKEDLMDKVNRDIPPIVKGSEGFHSVYFLWSDENELTAVWRWDSEKHWDAAFPKFAPPLSEYVIPNLTQAPERKGGEVVFQSAV